jgi:hypothetical protein
MSQTQIGILIGFSLVALFDTWMLFRMWRRERGQR